MEIKGRSIIAVVLICLAVGAGATFIYTSRGLAEAQGNIRDAERRNRELYEYIRSAARDSAAITAELSRATEHNRRLETQLDERDNLLRELTATVDALRKRIAVIVALIEEGAAIVN